MVIMVVGDENLADAANRHPHQSKLPRDAVSGVNEVRLIVDDENVCALRTSFVLRWSALRTQGDQCRLRSGLLSDGQLRQRCDKQCEDDSNRQPGINGSRMDHAAAPEQAWCF